MIKFDYNEPLFKVVLTSKEDIMTTSTPGGNVLDDDLNSGDIPIG